MFFSKNQVFLEKITPKAIKQLIKRKKGVKTGFKRR